MKIVDTYSYRHARAILEAEYAAEFQNIEAKKIDEPVAYFERVVRALPHAKMGITIPILVIGVSDSMSTIAAT